MTRDGIPVVLASLVSAVLSLVFWVVAARQYSSADLGVAAAAITTMVLLAELAQLGLRSDLVRVLPRAGEDGRRLAVQSYSLTVLVAIVLASIFIAGLGWWAPALLPLRQSVFTGALFILSTAFLVTYLLDEGAMLGLGMASWLPIEAGLFGLSRIVLLAPLAGLAGWLGDFGPLVSFAAPGLVAAGALGLVVWRALSRQPGTTVVADLAVPRLRSAERSLDAMLSNTKFDWAAGAARQGTIGGLPLLVLASEGGSGNAYFFVAWILACSVYRLSATVGEALAVDPSPNSGDSQRQNLHSNLLGMAIATPLVIVGVVAAPWVLQAFGTEYADESSTVLRLVLVGAIPNVVTRIHVSRLRIGRRGGVALGFELLVGLTTLLLAWGMLQLWGLVGVGLAWMVVLGVAATYVMVAESIWWWGPHLSGRQARMVGALVHTGNRWGKLRSLRSRNEQVRENLDALYPTQPSWTRLDSDADRQSIGVTGHDGRPPLRLELARTTLGSDLLSKRLAAVSELNQLADLAAFRGLIPYPIDHCREKTMTYLVESTISGRAGDDLDQQTSLEDRVGSMVAALTQLHRSTASSILVDQAGLDRWISRPLRTLGDSCGIRDDHLVALGRTLYSSLEGVRLVSGRIHGSLRLDRALFDANEKLTGLLGWEWSDNGPVIVDWGTLALSALMVQRQDDLAPVVVALLNEPEPFMTHPAFGTEPPEGVDAAALILFSWLHYLLPQLHSMVQHGTGRYWLARNVQPVMAVLPRPAPISR
ncbi:MAG: phosphotransferase [Actinomycetia bacterium]|nr:phosphotransferase [Actinomycetes bacterium]